MPRQPSHDSARLHGWVLGCSVAMATWLSDRWLVMLPGLLGVMAGVWLSRVQRQGAPPEETADPLTALNVLLMAASLAYLCAAFLLLQVAKFFELFAHDQDIAPPTLWFLAFFVALSLSLLALGLVLLVKMRLPHWLARVWERLIAER